jgi:hypothetical protein
VAPPPVVWAVEDGARQKILGPPQQVVVADVHSKDEMGATAVDAEVPLPND